MVGSAMAVCPVPDIINTTTRRDIGSNGHPKSVGDDVKPLQYRVILDSKVLGLEY